MLRTLRSSTRLEAIAIGLVTDTEVYAYGFERPSAVQQRLATRGMSLE